MNENNEESRDLMVTLFFVQVTVTQYHIQIFVQIHCQYNCILNTILHLSNKFFVLCSIVLQSIFLQYMKIYQFHLAILLCLLQIFPAHHLKPLHHFRQKQML